MLSRYSRSGAGPCQRSQSSHAGTATGLPRPIGTRRLVYQQRACSTLPIRPEWIMSIAAREPGTLRRWVPVCTTTPCFRWASTINSPSRGLWLTGFSQ